MTPLMHMKMALLVIGLVPLVWSAALWGVLFWTRKGSIPDDASEKSNLCLMLAPIVIGVGLTVFLALAPVRLPDIHVPLPLMAATPDVPVPDVTVPFEAQQPVKRSVDILPWLIMGCLGVYLTGVLWKGLQLTLAFLRLQRIVATASLSQVADEAVLITQADMPPFAWGRAAIIVPEGLAANLSVEHLRMIVLHERAHLQRGDTVWFALLGWIDALLWFNPFMSGQTRQCRMAAEIACDAAVTRAAPDMREAYARTLVRTLKHTAGDVRQYAPAVFSTDKSGDYSMRISEIMHAKPRTRKFGRKWLYAGLAVAALPVALAQLACSQSLLPAPAGRDLSRNVPIHASSKGVVINVGQPTGPIEGPDGKLYVQAVQLDNGDGIITTYHIRGGTTLKVGDKVRAGQLISTAGSSEMVFIPIKDLPAGPGIPAGNKTCLPNTRNICQLEGDLIHGFADVPQFVATGKAALYYKGRIIHADVIFSDPKAETATAEGHISITIDDTGISSAS